MTRKEKSQSLCGARTKHFYVPIRLGAKDLSFFKQSFVRNKVKKNQNSLKRILKNSSLDEKENILKPEAI